MHQLCVSTNQLLSPGGKKLLKLFLSLIHLTIIWTFSIAFPKIYFDKINSDFTLATQSCPTNYTRIDCNTPGIPVHHQLSEFAHTHVHWASDIIQPAHPLPSPSSCLQSFPASESSLLSQLFASGNQSTGVSVSSAVLPMHIQDWFL